MCVIIYFNIPETVIKSNFTYQPHQDRIWYINPLDSKGNYSATSNNTKLVHWPLMGGLLNLVQLGGAWAGWGPAQTPSRCTKCNSPPINGQCNTVLLFAGPLFCGFNVAI